MSLSFAFNPLGPPFDLVNKSQPSSGDSNFSYNLIADGETVVVPLGQQMLVDGPIRVLGHLSILGDVLDISNRETEKFFYDLITNQEVVTINENRLLLFKGHLQVNGSVRVHGRLSEV